MRILAGSPLPPPPNPGDIAAAEVGLAAADDDGDDYTDQDAPNWNYASSGRTRESTCAHSKYILPLPGVEGAGAPAPPEVAAEEEAEEEAGEVVVVVVAAEWAVRCDPPQNQPRPSAALELYRY